MDAELFKVVELFEAFGRQYKAGEVIRESDMASWLATPATKEEVELKVAALLARNRLDKIDPAEAAVEDAPAERYTPAEQDE